MKIFVILIAGMLLQSAAFARTGSHYVRGYTTRRGTYVQAHRATNPNHTKLDNWSTKGNVNPFTGKRGAVNPS